MTTSSLGLNRAPSCSAVTTSRIIGVLQLATLLILLGWAADGVGVRLLPGTAGAAAALFVYQQRTDPGGSGKPASRPFNNNSGWDCPCLPGAFR